MKKGVTWVWHEILFFSSWPASDQWLYDRKDGGTRGGHRGQEPHPEFQLVPSSAPKCLDILINCWHFWTTNTPYWQFRKQLCNISSSSALWKMLLGSQNMQHGAVVWEFYRLMYWKKKQVCPCRHLRTMEPPAFIVWDHLCMTVTYYDSGNIAFSSPSTIHKTHFC